MTDADQMFADAGQLLLTAVSDALGPWLVRSIEQLHHSWDGTIPAELSVAANNAAAAATESVVPRLRDLVEADVDAQWTTPLQIVRGAVSFATAVLADAGVPGVVRDPMVEKMSPGDVYGLEPAALADVDPELHTLGLVWGASKAKAHLARRNP
jgi:hypothetical protein